MLLPLATGLVSSALLILVSARASPEWGKRRTLFTEAGVSQAGWGARSFLALGAFGIAVGIPGTLGFVDANVLLVLGGLAAPTVARRLLSSASRTDSVEPVDYLWFVILAWSILAAGWLAGTLDLQGGLAAQAAVGPAALVPGTWVSAFACLGFLAGLLSAIFWVRSTASIQATAGRRGDVWLSWGEAALAGSAVSAAYFGPSVGALTHGPSTLDLQSGMAGSFLLTCIVVAGVSWSRKTAAIGRQRALQIACAGMALAALGAAALSR